MITLVLVVLSKLHYCTNMYADLNKNTTASCLTGSFKSLNNPFKIIPSLKPKGFSVEVTFDDLFNYNRENGC